MPQSGIYRLGARSLVAQKAPAQKPSVTQVSLEDVLKDQTVEISTVVDGHYLAGGNVRNYTLTDSSKSVGTQICKQAGYNEVLSVTTEKVGFPKDSHHAMNGYTYANVDLVNVSTDGSEPMHLKSYEVGVECDWNDCHDVEYQIAIKSVRCKKNATAGDVLAANDQMSSHYDADRRLAGLEEKPSQSPLGSSGSENTSHNGAAN